MSRDLLFCYFIISSLTYLVFPGEVLLRILGGAVPKTSPNPDPDSDQKNVIVLHPFSDLASKKLCHNYLDKNANKIDFLNSEFAYFSFFLIHMELKR